MATVEERLSRLEGGYEHLATKADIAEVKVEIAELKTEGRLTRWVLGLVVVTNVGIVAAIVRMMTNG